MQFFPSLFSSSRGQKVDQPVRDSSHARGPETLPAKMNLEERMAFRRELLFESIKATLNSRYIPVHSYRFKVSRTDKRGHCFVVMLDMTPAFMESPPGQHAELAKTAAALVKNAQTRYGLIVIGVYWRMDDTLNASVADWARPSTPGAPVVAPAEPKLSNVEHYERVTADELAAFEAAWHENHDIQIGDRTYSSDLSPLGEDLPEK